jgi:ATP-dependent 26S proteasome regulatory subunit
MIKINVNDMQSESLRELFHTIKARARLVYVVTNEEKRVMKEISRFIADPMNLEMFTWSVARGMVKYEDLHDYSPDKIVDDKTLNPKAALSYIEDYTPGNKSRGALFIMRDMNYNMAQAIPRQLKDITYDLKKKTIIVVGPELGQGSVGGQSGIPLTLDKEFVVIEYDLMNRNQIEEIVVDFLDSSIKVLKNRNIKGAKDSYDKDEVEAIVMACQGLTETEIEASLKKSFAELNCIDPATILKIKEQIIRKSQILEFVKSGAKLKDVGGLDRAKEYFEVYKRSFTEEARSFGVEPPSGILLTGVPGTGKSLLAKAMCESWNLPGIRLDIGKVMTGLVGGSEQRMREAIKQAEAIAPCVLWIDEVEKAMSGVKSSNQSDAGTMSRVFGTFLTWMQEKTAPVVVLATANDITQVPPEFIRRFNEVFFVDLPSKEERSEIFKIHLSKRNRDPEKFDITKLVESSDKFTGAEIEKAITHAIASAFNQNDNEVEDKHVLDALAGTKPIHKVMGEKIREIQSWARNRARYASSHAESVATGSHIETNEVDGDDDMIDVDDIELNKKPRKTKAKAKKKA